MAKINEIYKAYGVDKTNQNLDKRAVNIMKNANKFGIKALENKYLLNELLNLEFAEISDNLEIEVAKLLVFLENTQNLAQISDN